MRIGRTLPPAASPIPMLDIIRALPSCLHPDIRDNRFEEQIQQEFNSKYCFFLSSGKAALTVILLALKKIYPERDHVVLPAFTCYSVPAAVKRAGLQIKLCDLAPSSLDLDQEKLKSIIAEDKENNKILCVLPTHLFGCPADVAGIRTIVGPKIPIIEDAAQAMGETLNNRKLGTLGDIGFFSLGRGKALSTMEGGIIVTDRENLAKIIRSLIVSLTGYNTADNLRSAFKTILTTILQYPSLFWLPKSLPFLRLGETLYEPDFPLRRLSYFHLKLTRNWLNRLEHHRRARKRNLNYWLKRLPSSFVQVCRKTDGSLIRLPVLSQTREQRDYIIQQSEQLGLGIMPAYPTSINMIPKLAATFLDEDYPQAEDVCTRLLTLPVHEYIQDGDNEQIFSLLQNSIIQTL